jgi:hypothetical protein
MATTVLSNCTVLVDGVNLSGACNEATVNYSAEMLDETTFGVTTRIRKGGLTAFSVALKGFALQGTSCEPDALMQPIVGSSGTIFCFFPTTLQGCAANGVAGRCVVESYTPGGAVGTIVPFAASLAGAGVEG